MSSELTDLVAVLVLGAGCWALRALFVLAVPAERLPAVVVRALRHLAPAALGSICAVEVVGVVQGADAASAVAGLAVVAAAVVAAVVTRSMGITVVTGAAAVLLVDLVLLAPA
jgi:branched-subunit amino acid transport protein